MTATSPKPQVVLLAAGASARLGQPKALVSLPGGTPLERLVAAARPWSAGPVRVLTGAHRAAIEQVLPAGAEAQWHEAWALGRTSTVQAAIRALPNQDLLLAPVDCPRVPSAVFAALVQAWWAAGNPPEGWLAPSFRASQNGSTSFGHPILIGRALAAQALALGPDQPLRDLRSRARPLWGESVPHPEILEDLDTPEDLQQLSQRDRERL